eukprot:CAMPEP_0206468722 /NCGR_PEP_ID=MMETSP0324_2-20121206/29817_1 /ASSEMBLY_ACC=CAM_ASM_000836 /TAXON_ID=2866 /ORGANISM="Crypthecodinium cohnii, Strain Seligo" /LENGTH=48 /DNA_ID= /DNA_START= /DNA_END= /DNA_ORIENTATION=
MTKEDVVKNKSRDPLRMVLQSSTENQCHRENLPTCLQGFTGHTANKDT